MAVRSLLVDLLLWSNGKINVTSNVARLLSILLCLRIQPLRDLHVAARIVEELALRMDHPHIPESVLSLAIMLTFGQDDASGSEALVEAGILRHLVPLIATPGRYSNLALKLLRNMACSGSLSVGAIQSHGIFPLLLPYLRSTDAARSDECTHAFFVFSSAIGVALPAQLLDLTENCQVVATVAMQCMHRELGEAQIQKATSLLFALARGAHAAIDTSRMLCARARALEAECVMYLTMMKSCSKPFVRTHASRILHTFDGS